MPREAAARWPATLRAAGPRDGGFVKEVTAVVIPHAHTVQPEDDGWLRCTDCGSALRPGAESGIGRTSRYYAASLPNGQRLIFQVLDRDQSVLWMDHWALWYEGVRAGFFRYEAFGGTGHIDVYYRTA